MKASVLVVEDVPEMGELVALYLRKEGLQVVLAPTAEAALGQVANQDFQLILLDLNLPGMDGFEFLQTLRKTSEVPVMIVSARDEDEDMVLGLGLGADDFVVKPFSPRVLVARCRALLKRRQPTSADSVSTSIPMGDVLFLPEARQLQRAGQKIPLSSREFDLLKFLTEHPGVAFRPEELYERVWGQAFGDISAVGVYLQRLRKKIESSPSEPQYLQTVRGFGYTFQPKGQPV